MVAEGAENEAQCRSCFAWSKVVGLDGKQTSAKCAPFRA